MFKSGTLAGEMTSNTSSNDVHKHNSRGVEVDFYQESAPLPRYRSAPRSFLAALMDSPADNSSSGDESEALFSAIWSGPLDLNHKGGDDSCQMQFGMQDTGAESEIRSGFSSGLTVYSGAGSGGGSAGSGTERQVQLRSNCGNGSNPNLLRQNSSPAGFFSGCGLIGDVGNYGAHRANSSATDVSSSQLNFSGPSLSPRIIPNIPDNRGSKSEHSRNVEAPFSHDSWTECLKRNHDGNLKMFSTFNEVHNQTAETGRNSPKLIHHLSLPTTSTEKGESDRIRFLQFQPDAAPCQMRAKRGCATHPRSIAERMRRTRISEKMKKLQELFPNMDKQTSTADMLDLAVEYIKDLQHQLQTLTDAKAKCICISKQRLPNNDN